MTPRALPMLAGSILLCTTGCAAFVGYRHETVARPLPGSLRGVATPSDASVDLSTAPNAAHGGLARQKRVSLAEVVGAARQHANLVLEAAARVDAASGRVQSADGALLPSIGVEAGGSYLHGRDINNAGEVLDGLSYGRFEPSASIFYRINPGAAVAQAQRWRSEAEAASYDAREAERTAALQAGLGYFDLVLAHASFQIAESLVADAERFLGIAQARAQAEIGSGADVARAEAEAARARQTSLRARSRWEQASVRLAVLLRWNPTDLLLPADRELRRAALVNPERGQELHAEAEAARPDLQSRRARAAAASRLTTTRWWELLGPELNAGVRERLIGRELSDLDNTTFAHVFVGFSFDFGEIGRLRTAQGEARAATVREQARREEVRGEVTAAALSARTASETIPEAQAGVQAAERSYRIQLDRFQAGTGLGIEVIEAQNAQARARQELAEAIVRYNLAQVELAASIGHLAPDLLGSSSDAAGPDE